jgi:hypothetical protein
MYPSSRCLISSTRSRCCAFGFTIKMACVSKISVTISRPAALCTEQVIQHENS